MVFQTNAAILQGRGGPLLDVRRPCPAQVLKRPVARRLRFKRCSSSDGPRCMCKRIRNISVVCIVRCITAVTPSVRTGWCQGPAPGRTKEHFAATLELGRQKTKFSWYVPHLFFGNFLCPACQRAGHTPAAEGQNAQTQRLRWRDADALKRNRSAPQFHPTRAGLQFRHFHAWRCRKSSRVHNDGDATLC